MRTRPIYTDEFRSSAVLLLEAAGWPNTKGALARTASKLGLYEATLLRWARRKQNPPPNELVSIKRLEVKDIVDEIFHGFSEELMERIKRGDLIDDATATILSGWGISFDKNRLLENKSTENNAVSLRIRYENDWRAPGPAADDNE